MAGADHSAPRCERDRVAIAQIEVLRAENDARGANFIDPEGSIRIGREEIPAAQSQEIAAETDHRGAE